MEKGKLLQELEEEILGDILEEGIFGFGNNDNGTKKPDGAFKRGVKSGWDGVKAGWQSGKEGASKAFNDKKAKDEEAKKVKMAEQEALQTNQMLERFLKTMKGVLKTQLGNLGKKSKYDASLQQALTAMSEDEDFLNKWVERNGQYLTQQIELTKKAIEGNGEARPDLDPNEEKETNGFENKQQTQEQPKPAPAQPTPANKPNNTSGLGNIGDAI